MDIENMQQQETKKIKQEIAKKWTTQLIIKNKARNGHIYHEPKNQTVIKKRVGSSLDLTNYPKRSYILKTRADREPN